MSKETYSMSKETYVDVYMSKETYFNVYMSKETYFNAYMSKETYLMPFPSLPCRRAISKCDAGISRVGLF